MIAPRTVMMPSSGAASRFGSSEMTETLLKWMSDIGKTPIWAASVAAITSAACFGMKRHLIALLIFPYSITMPSVAA